MEPPKDSDSRKEMGVGKFMMTRLHQLGVEGTDFEKFSRGELTYLDLWGKAESKLHEKHWEQKRKDMPHGEELGFDADEDKRMYPDYIDWAAGIAAYQVLDGALKDRKPNAIEFIKRLSEVFVDTSTIQKGWKDIQVPKKVTTSDPHEWLAIPQTDVDSWFRKRINGTFDWALSTTIKDLVNSTNISDNEKGRLIKGLSDTPGEQRFPGIVGISALQDAGLIEKF